MKYLTTKQVAEIAGCATETVARAVKAGKMDGHRGEMDRLCYGGARRIRAHKQIWLIEPESGRAWAIAARERHRQRY